MAATLFLSPGVLPVCHLPSRALPQFFGDGIVAVVAGIVAQEVFSMGGAEAVFTLSAAVLGVAGMLATVLWSENLSISAPAKPGKSTSPLANLSAALSALFSDSRVVAVGLVQSLFEGSMYSFVMVWAPFLKSASAAGGSSTPLPFGLIFASFMVCVMVGSSVFSLASSSRVASPGQVLVGVMAVGAVSLCAAGVASSVFAVAGGFLMFESACGVYFPRCVRRPWAHALCA